MPSFVWSWGARAARVVCVAVLGAALSVPVALAQAPGQARAPQFKSFEVSADHQITFRVYAPKAQAVRVSAGDLAPFVKNGTEMKKGDNGVWEVTLGPAAPGAYRYTFDVDGVATVDPKNPDISESLGNVSSLVAVPGNDLFDTKDVPHGAVAAVTYRSTALGTVRRMHVYTPPGYERGVGQYPVFYLLHGAGDNDDAWTSVGRAGFILDNLIAAKKAKPMVVVMPAGHTPRVEGSPIGANATEAFVNDFVKDVMPYVESHYRVLKGRANTAIAGLSMGGSQTLAIAIPRLDRFAYVGVFSSGLLTVFSDRIRRERQAVSEASNVDLVGEWERQNAATIDRAALKPGLKLLWLSTGKDDFLLEATHGTVDLLKKHGFAPVYKESEGGHTWVNWRDYLVEFAPRLFQR